MKNIYDQTLALSSMFQSATLIDQLANGKAINQAAFDCSFDSLFTLNAETTQDIYGYGEGLIQGMRTLIFNLSGEKKSLNRQVVYYILSMIKLESKLKENAPAVKTIQQGLEDIEKQVEMYDMTQSAKLQKIDGLYQKTISQIKPQIIVQGQQLYLENSDISSKVRTLLFSGIRAAVFWKQRGGSRFKLIFYRKKYQQEARQQLERFLSARQENP